MQNPVISNAENSGWTLESGTYDIKWFSGSQMPTHLQDNVADLEVNNIGESDCTMNRTVMNHCIQVKLKINLVMGERYKHKPTYTAWSSSISAYESYVHSSTKNFRSDVLNFDDNRLSWTFFSFCAGPPIIIDVPCLQEVRASLSRSFIDGDWYVSQTKCT
jgi:hypothetical protein